MLLLFVFLVLLVGAPHRPVLPALLRGELVALGCEEPAVVVGLGFGHGVISFGRDSEWVPRQPSRQTSRPARTHWEPRRSTSAGLCVSDHYSAVLY